jgi:hypothetical protein
MVRSRYDRVQPLKTKGSSNMTEQSPLEVGLTEGSQSCKLSSEERAGREPRRCSPQKGRKGPRWKRLRVVECADCLTVCLNWWGHCYPLRQNDLERELGGAGPLPVLIGKIVQLRQGAYQN